MNANYSIQDVRNSHCQLLSDERLGVIQSQMKSFQINAVSISVYISIYLLDISNWCNKLEELVQLTV